MKRRWRVALIVLVVAVIALVGALANGELLRATYWTARAENCGSLAVASNVLVSSTTDAQRAVNCYAQAAAHCRAAALVVNAIGSDFNATYTFVVEPPFSQGSACEIAANADVSDASGDNTSVAPCQRVTQTPSALKITACGGLGDVTLPAVHAGIGAI